MTDELRARCVELLESYGIPTDRAPQLEAELQCIRRERKTVGGVPERKSVEEVPGRTELGTALDKIDRATKLLEAATKEAPQWPTVNTAAVRLREFAYAKRRASKAATGRSELRKALDKMDRAVKLLEAATNEAPEWSTVKTAAVKLRESADTKRRALKALGRRQDFPKGSRNKNFPKSRITSFDLERQVSRLGSFWKACGKSPTRSVDSVGDEYGAGFVEGGQFVGFLRHALELVDMHASPDQIAHAIRSMANIDRELN